MYRRGKKKQRKGRNKKVPTSEVHCMTDFTVQEFANNPKPLASFRKKHLTSSSAFTKQAMQGIPKHLDDVMSRDEDIDDWYERDLSEFDCDVSDYKQVEIISEEMSEKSDKNQKNSKVREEEYIGRVYPEDLWYVLADYIHPEDVGRFSALCKGAFHVTNSAGYWRKLYTRYWRDKVFLPSLLHPYHIRHSEDCLRARVISALYRLYEPFQDRNHPGMMDLDQIESYNLIGSTCLYSWFQDCIGNRNAYHYLKFRRQMRPSEQNARNGLIGSPSLWANPCDSEMLLKVTCPSFQHFSCGDIMGLRLASLSLSVGHDMCYNRFKMEFVKNYRIGKRINTKETRTVVVLDPVICVSVLNWWHPLFSDTYASHTHSERRRGLQTNNDSLWDA